MTTHGTRDPERRALTVQESALLRWLLDHGKPSAKSHLGEIDGLQVVSRCGCGCASIDFIQAPNAALEVLSDYRWRDDRGHLFGIFAFAKGGKLAGLELWSIDGDATPTLLPDPSFLAPIG